VPPVSAMGPERFLLLKPGVLAYNPVPRMGGIGWLYRVNGEFWDVV